MHGVIGATDALQEDRDAARRAELAHQLDVADVDAELERGGGHHHLEFAGLETLLGIEAGFLRETAVVGRDILLTETLGEVAGDALHHAAGVGEHQRGVMFFDEPGELVVHRRPHLARHHRLQRRGRHHQVDVAFADVATVDDVGDMPRSRAGQPGTRLEDQSPSEARPLARTRNGSGRADPISDQQARDFLDGLLRRGEPDALDGLRGIRVHARQSERQVRTALGLRDGVDFVDDHRAHRREHLAPRGAGQQQIEGLRRRHEDVRRSAPHRSALGLRGVAGAHLRAHFRRVHAQSDQLGGDARERRLEIALDVVGERLQRGDVHNTRSVLQPAGRPFAHQRIDGGEKCGQRLARARGRRDQRVFAARNGRPRVELRRRRAIWECGGEPRLHRRVKLRQGHGRHFIQSRRVDPSSAGVVAAPVWFSRRERPAPPR